MRLPKIEEIGVWMCEYRDEKDWTLLPEVLR